ncbi:hypothetical protein HMPREF9318_01767 [Streptococcus urinalis FB127-CNA-2]|uniref:KR domain protein n=1 Tax=Streptococcus urinalis 2285-97 TaxID=764291 RepID=G5KE81_9STRE|nr:SDR family oxidoreductase [Streptococcus urinalis]EHJ56062.1 KR domain protein [Streptococcus urinalis 2285-97]EKS18268.1 hypothetical protein HMPREF9318_01767 [Streptococcus urinalis FB127-CNA-2]VEF32858.1 acetoin reductase [Streptococcus urinalis]
MGTLSGKTALITGASSGFGEGTAYSFAKEGCQLILTARRENRLKEVAAKCEELGGSAIYVVGDARSEQTAEKVVKKALDAFGQIDILINNAGIGRVQSLMETSMADFDLIMETDVRSAYAYTRAVVPDMLKRHAGQIILVSSVTGIKGQKNETAYSCSKFALRGLGQALQQELLSEGIKTTVFCPHAGVTEFEIGHGRDRESNDKSGFLTPEDVGNALLQVCTQTDNCYVAELCLASNNVVFFK